MKNLWIQRLPGLMLALMMLISATGTAMAGDDVGAYGWEKPKETLEFSVYLGQGDPENIEKDKTEKSNHAMDKWLLENMNVKINEEWYMDSPEQRISLMMLDGSYPDLLAYVNQAASALFVASGKAVDLAPYLEEYAPNILAEMGDYIELFKDEEGHIYRLPSHWGYKVDSTIAESFSIRYDWWQELGTDLYTTPEEYYQQIKQVLANHPTNADGQKVYAFTDYNGGKEIMNAMLGAYGFIKDMKMQEDGTLQHWMLTDEAAEICEYVNRFWREDMIDPDFVTHSYDTWRAMGVSDRAAGDLGTWWRTFVMGHEYWQEMDPNTDITRRFLNAQVTAEGVAQNTLATKNMLCEDVADGAYWCITDKCKDVPALLTYLNWEWSPFGTMVVQYGYPDENNVYDIIDGKIVFKDEALDASNKNVAYHGVLAKYDASKYWLTTRRSCLDMGALKMPFEIDPRAAWNNWGTGDLYAKQPDGSAYLDPGWEICWGKYDMTTAVDTTLYNAIFDADSYEFTVKQNVNDIVSTAWINIVTAPTAEDCQAALAEARESLIAADVDILMQYYTNVYNANMAKINAAK